MAYSYYRVSSDEIHDKRAGSTKEIQHMLQNAAPGVYPIEIIIAEDEDSESETRPWGRAIKHEDGMVHVESDQPGD